MKFGQMAREHRLTVVSEESFRFFAFCWHEASYEVVSDGCQQDHQEDNLSLRDRDKVRNMEGGLNYTSNANNLMPS